MNSSPLDRILRTLSSLRITLVVLGLIIALIFFSTLAQRFLGIWFVLENYFKHPIAWVEWKIFVPAGKEVSGGFPFFGGVTLGVALLINLLAAFALKFRLTSNLRNLLLGALVAAGGAALIVAGHLVPAWRTQLSANPVSMLVGGLLLYTPITVGFMLLYGRKGGMVLVHLSVILLVVGQGITSYQSLETRLVLKEGEAQSFTEDGREYELAVIEPKNDGSGMDKVMCIPQSRLAEWPETKAAVFDLPSGLMMDVKRWIPNTRLGISEDAKPDENMTISPPSGAPMLVGKRLTLEDAPTANGIGQAMEDVPSVVVNFVGHPENKPSIALYGGDATPRKIPGTDISLQLRPRRHSLGYAVRLEKFSHDLYPGTSTPKNFASKVVVLEQGKPERTVNISMNQPLRMERETLFQASFIGEDTTVLQVVQNPGWTIPYIACALGTVGLLVHFMLSLWKFLDGKTAKPVCEKEQSAETGAQATVGSVLPGWLLPALAVIAVAATVGYGVISPSFESRVKSNITAAGELPVVAGGRVQPMDSLARNALLTLSGRSELRLPAVGGQPTRKLRATEWLLDVFTDPKLADTYPILLIDHDEVKTLIHKEKSPEKRFSMADILPYFNGKDLGPAFEEAGKTPHEKRDARQHALIELEGRIGLYAKLRGRSAMLVIPPPLESSTNAGRDPAGWLPLPDALATMQQQGWSSPAQVKDWAKTLEAWQKTTEGSKQLQDEVEAWSNLLTAWQGKDPAVIRTAVRDLHGKSANIAPQAARHAEVEAFFNQTDPFYGALWIYISAALCVFASWAFWRIPLLRTAFVLIAIGFAIHTLGLGTRIWLSGRPPVTNLYSSAVFVGWAMAGFSLVAEWVLARFLQLRLGFALLVGAIAGALTLQIAGKLAEEGDTMAVLQAVLDTNFWLATHVVVVTLGYAATFLAGTLGIIHLIFGLLAPGDKKTIRTLTGIIYGTLCFALLFSFVGTILGGIWADQSWGRFWGWDPKENGAMMIVLWNILILHARMGGIVKDRGLAMLAVFGNIVTAWSWFGVNQLGAGLHSYGFTSGVVVGLLLFIMMNLGIIGLGFLPSGKPKLDRF